MPTKPGNIKSYGGSSDNKVCEASLDYKYEYNRLLKQNEDLKNTIKLCKNVIEELATLANTKIN